MDHSKTQFILMMILLELLQFHPTAGFIDCRTSCRRCREGYEHDDVLEVYCSMCKECRDRRRERTGSSNAGTTHTLFRKNILDHTNNVLEGPYPVHHKLNSGPYSVHKNLNSGQFPARGMRQDMDPPHIQKYLRKVQYAPSILEGWPEGCPTPPVCEEESIEILSSLKTTTITTTTTTTTTTRPTCPPILTCIKKKKETPTCTPCMPMCPCPVPKEINIDIKLKTTHSSDCTTAANVIIEKRPTSGDWLEHHKDPGTICLTDGTTPKMKAAFSVQANLAGSFAFGRQAGATHQDNTLRDKANGNIGPETMAHGNTGPANMAQESIGHTNTVPIMYPGLDKDNIARLSIDPVNQNQFVGNMNPSIVEYNGNLHYTGVNDRGTTYSGDVNYNGNMNYMRKETQQTAEKPDDYFYMYVGIPKPFLRSNGTVEELAQLLSVP